MIIRYKDLFNGSYNINCKYYLPDSGSIHTVILGVHGFAGDKESSALEAVAAKGADCGTALVCFDFPAHGVSPVCEEQFTIRNCMADLLFMADMCRREFPEAEKRLFATSYGGYISLLCYEGLEEFDIVLRAPAVTFSEHILLDLLGVSPEEFREKGVVQCGFDRKIELPYAFYEEMQNNRVMDKNFSKKEVLLIHGDRDDVVPHEDILLFCRQNPMVKLVVVPGADHRFKKAGELDAVVDAAYAFWGRGDK